MAVSRQISDRRPPQRREADSRPRRVVLIEDSTDYALLVTEMVRDALGEDTEVMAHPSLAASRRSEDLAEADCVLLDLSLPDAAGLEGLTQMREVAPDVPVIVLSGQDSEEMAVQAVHEGAQDYLVKRYAGPHLLGRAIRYAIERKRSELELARRSLHDPLTDLANRSLFKEQLEVALARADRGEHDLAVMFLDLDGFKAVNDALGHEVGDGLLKGVARRLSALVRPGDTVARFGGDEFLVLCDDIADRRHAVLVAERLSGGLVDPFVIDSHEIYLGASIGIALAGDRSATSESLIRDADQAMYEAKRARSRYRVAEGPSRAIAGGRSALEGELDRAVERDELRLYYQPEVDLARRTIFAVEALLRWQHPDRGMVPPPDFLPTAEETGAIVPIGEWVLSAACAQLARWRRDGMCTPDLSVSVNLSLRQLCDHGLVAAVSNAIEAADLPPSSVCLEIAEAAVAVDNERASRQLESLKQLGVSLSLDDFGAGASSLEALNRYPLDMLKIDRSLVQRLDDGLRPRRMFESIVAVAHALDLSVVAEGIETKTQLEQIAAVGCDAAQGFYLSRPGAAALIGPTLRQTPAVAAA
jgi:diguanylate cyclase (GGDEF)-like protein